MNDLIDRLDTIGIVVKEIANASADEIERLERELAEAREVLRRARPHLRNRQIDFEICRPSQGDTGQLQKWRNDIGEILARINAFLGEQK